MDVKQLGTKYELDPFGPHRDVHQIHRLLKRIWTRLLETIGNHRNEEIIIEKMKPKEDH